MDGLRGDIGVTMPAWSVYGLGVLFIAIALAIPWLVRWQGWLRGEVSAVEKREPRAVRPVMLVLPGGEFWMGSPEGEPDRDDSDEGPRHRVIISSFEMCETEVTQGQYEAVMGENPSLSAYGRGDDLPVQNVSWLDAVGYLNALSRLEELEPCYEIAGEDVEWKRPCKGYRLPTEAEWEYAARAGSGTAYHFGNDAAMLGEHAWYVDNSNNTVHEAKSKKPNAWYLYNMPGNVWEWVWDWYGPYRSPASTEPERNPIGLSKAEAPIVDTMDNDLNDIKVRARVLRGGSFVVGAGALRSASRDWGGPSLRYWYLGFRCARSGAPALSD